MGATKVGELKTVNAVLRRALKPGMPLPQFKKVVGALEPQLKAGMQAQLTKSKLERCYRDHKSENTQVVDRPRHPDLDLTRPNPFLRCFHRELHFSSKKGKSKSKTSTSQRKLRNTRGRTWRSSSLGSGCPRLRDFRSSAK